MAYRNFTDQEERWIKSLQRVMAKAPDTLFMFIGSGDMIVYTKTDDNKIYMSDAGGIDDGAPSKSILTQMSLDGGDW